MMKKLIFLLASILLSTCCYAQQEDTISTQQRRVFDLKLYLEHTVDREYKYRTVDAAGDSIEVVMSNSTNHYQEIIRPIGSALQKRYQYAASTNLLFENESLHGCEIGINRQYNEAGEIIAEHDYRNTTPFSWQDLAKLLKEDYNVDMLSDKYIHCVLFRNTDNARKMYYFSFFRATVFSPMGPAYTKARYHVTADTGEVVFVCDKTGTILVDRTKDFPLDKAPKKKDFKKKHKRKKKKQ